MCIWRPYVSIMDFLRISESLIRGDRLIDLRCKQTYDLRFKRTYPFHKSHKKKMGGIEVSYLKF